MVSICHAALATDLSIFKLLMLGGRSANSNFLNMFPGKLLCPNDTVFLFIVFRDLIRWRVRNMPEKEPQPFIIK